jgi:hypothetical protein
VAYVVAAAEAPDHVVLRREAVDDTAQRQDMTERGALSCDEPAHA